MVDKTFEEILTGLKDNSLIVEGKDRVKKLDLTKFNSSVSNASTNLGKIIPSIIDVSKEQVAVINHGLENVIAFSRVFQTVNTSVAIMVQTGKVDKDIKKIEEFEDSLVNNVLETLEGLDKMLDETCKEIDIYYGALAKIINSTGNSDYSKKFSRSALSDNLKKSFEGLNAVRTKGFTKEIKIDKGLGIFQIIDNLGKLNKEIKKINLTDGEVRNEIYISTIKDQKIQIDIDILQALQSTGNSLINSLQKVGQLSQEEGESTEKIKIVLKKEKEFVKKGIDEIKRFKDLIKNKNSLTTYLKEIIKNINYVENVISSNSEQEFKKFEKKMELNNKKKDLMKKHDLIIKRQMEIIHNVINLFSSIVSVWGWQVDEEIHIGQVADKTVIALKQLSKLQIKIDLNTDALLIAEKTQESISNTCDVAKSLKSVGKVMQMLLKRVKKTIQMNSMIENELIQMNLTKEEYEKYKNERIEKIMGLLAKKFPKIQQEASKNIKELALPNATSDIVKEVELLVENKIHKIEIK